MGFMTDFKIDIVFVIDSTESMAPIKQQVQQFVLSFGDQICKGFEKVWRPINQLRVKVIDFADFATEGYDAIRSTDFFTLPDEMEYFEKAIKDIGFDRRDGKGAENGLEALYYAIKSDWVKFAKGEYGRQVIVLITDALPLHLQERAGCEGYFEDDYPSNVEELSQVWHADAQFPLSRLVPDEKRLVLFAPEGADEAEHSWTNVIGWEYSTYFDVNAKVGLENVDLDAIIAEIVRGW